MSVHPQGPVVLIIGGTRGIGHATARQLAAAGARIVLTGTDGDTAELSASAIADEFAVAATGMALDLVDTASIAPLIKLVAAEHGGIDGLVVSAGVMPATPIGMTTVATARQVLDINLLGAFEAVQAATKVMLRRRHGAIVLVGSVVGESGSPGQSLYAASKAGLVGLVRSAARELGPHGIRVNAVSPGLVQTDLLAAMPAERVAEHVARTPLRRVGTAGDIARVIQFLLGDDAGFVTGQMVGVNGGLSL